MGKNVQVVDYLLENGADINEVDRVCKLIIMLPYDAKNEFITHKLMHRMAAQSFQQQHILVQRKLLNT